ncbi:uncharacterized protein RAG0_15517 [Rhynchosporium agropyri]|uniref:Uncharacterized protein n=1 Tax=Rhynchosporium agropyri TaxID=914238 RepID=A0A1E1LNF3_9HELO|nr:uncharacterized protein RAG0_15517 [Rhynchosporium agropyri]
MSNRFDSKLCCAGLVLIFISFSVTVQHTRVKEVYLLPSRLQTHPGHARARSNTHSCTDTEV